MSVRLFTFPYKVVFWAILVAFLGPSIAVGQSSAEDIEIKDLRSVISKKQQNGSFRAYEEAEPLAERLVELIAERNGNTSPEYARELRRLAVVRIETRKYSSALKIIAKAADIFVALGDESGLQEMSLLEASARFKSGDYEKAIDIFEAYLNTFDEAPTFREWWKFRDSVGRSSMAYEELGDFESPILGYRRAIEILRKGKASLPNGVSEKQFKKRSEERIRDINLLLARAERRAELTSRGKFLCETIGETIAPLELGELKLTTESTVRLRTKSIKWLGADDVLEVNFHDGSCQLIDFRTQPEVRSACRGRAERDSQTATEASPLPKLAPFLELDIRTVVRRKNSNDQSPLPSDKRLELPKKIISMALNQTGRRGLAVWMVNKGTAVKKPELPKNAEIFVAETSSLQKLEDFESAENKIVLDESWKGFTDIVASVKGAFLLAAAPRKQFQERSLDDIPWPNRFKNSTLWQKDAATGQFNSKTIHFERLPKKRFENFNVGQIRITADLRRLLVASTNWIKSSWGGMSLNRISSFDLAGKLKESCKFESSTPPTFSPSVKYVAFVRNGILKVLRVPGS